LEVIARIIQTFQKGSIVERRGAARDLEQLGPAAEGAIPALLADLRNGDKLTRSAAIEVLALIGRPAVPFLIEALQKPEMAYRQAAAVTLEMIGPDAADAIPALEAIPANDKLQSWAVKALRAIREKPRGPLARKLPILLIYGVAFIAVLAVVGSSLAFDSLDGLSSFPLPPGLAIAGIFCVIASIVIGAIQLILPADQRASLLWTACVGLGSAFAGTVVGGIIHWLVLPVVQALGRH
jgi:hypothetical protein